MKLPLIHLKSIKKIKEGKCLIFRNKDNLLNNLFYPNNSINLEVNDIKAKIPKFVRDFKHRTQKSINHLSLRNEKESRKKETKSYFLNTNISIINNNKTNSIHFNKKNNNTDESNNNKDDDESIEKLKNPLNSFKIRKEISSLIFSSPENQNKFINYILNGTSYNHSSNKKKNKTNSKRLIVPVNLRQKMKLKLLNEEKEEDEDKTNLKDESLYSLFFHKDKNEKKKENCEEKNIIKNIKRMKCWNNNILKDILPQNIKNYFEYKSQKVLQNDNCNNNTFRKISGIHHRNNRLKTLLSVNDKTDKSKYNFGDSGEKYKKINNILLKRQKKNNNIKIKWKKRFLRSSSTDLN
jgi:hypothetical protein